MISLSNFQICLNRNCNNLDLELGISMHMLFLDDNTCLMDVA